MADINACLKLGRELAEAVRDGDERVAGIKAADFLSAWKEPQRFSPWSLHNQRAAR